MSIRLAKNAPPYKVEGYNFYVYHDGGSSIDLMLGPVNWANDTLPRKADTTIRTEVANTFKEFGLEKLELMAVRIIARKQMYIQARV